MQHAKHRRPIRTNVEAPGLPFMAVILHATYRQPDFFKQESIGQVHSGILRIHRGFGLPSYRLDDSSESMFYIAVARVAQLLRKCHQLGSWVSVCVTTLSIAPQLRACEPKVRQGAQRGVQNVYISTANHIGCLQQR